jgi:hypothetical protein
VSAMYKIDTQTNQLIPLENQSFSALGFREREHLQEWLAQSPQALGEELLIIQKEFDGFDDTRERLDLLALDKEGHLVIIENKLDDSGRDVVWQALKYASYCSTLTTAQIVEIHQRYLSKQGISADARSQIAEFLEVPDLDEVALNMGNHQRLIFVAAYFRREVTSTVLWLLNHGLQIQCFKVTPYRSGNELFLNIEQIIPTPEAKEMMISMAVKEAEEKNAGAELKHRHKLRLHFWQQCLEAFKNSKCSLFNNISPAKDYWLNAGSGFSGVPYTLIFGKKEVRIQIEMMRREGRENTFIFNHLLEQKSIIETAFGADLEWLPLEDKKACRIAYSLEIESYNPENWPRIIEWMIDKMMGLESAIEKPLKQAMQELKQHPELTIASQESEVE